MWSGSSAANGTLRRGGSASWGKEMDNRTRAKEQDLRRRRGKGTWGSETKNLYREQRRRERAERRGRNLLYKLLG